MSLHKPETVHMNLTNHAQETLEQDLRRGTMATESLWQRLKKASLCSLLNKAGEGDTDYK